MFAHEFIRNAYLAGTFTALAAGIVGWFVVLRAQVFAGDALSHIAFTGTVAAAAVGIDARIGLFAGTLGLAAVMAAVGPRVAVDDATIGTVFAWILGLGVLFVTLAAGGTGIATANTLFGSIFGLDAAHARVAAGVALVAAVATAALARPLLFASVDPAVARVSGVPVRAVGVAFMLILGAVAGEATQAVGALLLLGLIAAPAGAARRLTADPWTGLALSTAIAVACMWIGLALSYAINGLPPSSAVILTAAVVYLLATAFAGRTQATARLPWLRGSVADQDALG